MIRLQLEVDWQPGASALDAAVPVIVAEFLTLAAHGIDTAVQALGVQDFTLSIEPIGAEPIEGTPVDIEATP